MSKSKLALESSVEELILKLTHPSAAVSNHYLLVFEKSPRPLHRMIL